MFFPTSKFYSMFFLVVFFVFLNNATLFSCYVIFNITSFLFGFFFHFRTRPSINPDVVEDQCEITLNSEPTLYRELSNFYECIMSRCSQDFAPIQGIRVCCDNAREPCLVAILKTSSSVTPVTKVLIEKKKTLYGWAITVGGKWWRAKKKLNFKFWKATLQCFLLRHERHSYTTWSWSVVSALTSLNKGRTGEDIKATTWWLCTTYQKRADLLCLGTWSWSHCVNIVILHLSHFS